MTTPHSSTFGCTLRLLMLLLVATALLAPIGNVGAVTYYDFTDLGTLGGKRSLAFGINDAGQVIGSSYLPGNKVFHATRWDGTTPVDLGTLGGNNSTGYGINSSGATVGQSILLPSFVMRANRWDGTTPTDFGRGLAFAINDSGQVAVSNFDGFNPRAIRFDGAAAVDLGSGYAQGINNAGQVVGFNQSGGLAHAIRWDGNIPTILDPLAGSHSVAYGINDNSQVVGYSSISGVSHATRWDNNVATDLCQQCEISSVAYDINNVGQAVGYSLSNVGQRATLWSGTKAIDLSSLLSIDNGEWILTQATGINNKGVITGIALNTDTGNMRAFLFSPTDLPYPLIPEPKTNALVLAGLSLMTAVFCRRIKASAK